MPTENIINDNDLNGGKKNHREPSEMAAKETEGSAIPQKIRFQIYLLLIFIAGGLIFGRIMAVDSIPDRTIQEYRRAQIKKELTEKSRELQKQGCSPEKIKAELSRYGKSLLQASKKERPTLSANDRSRWLTLRALVEPESRVYRYLPLDESGKVKDFYKIGEIKRNCASPAPDRFDPKLLQDRKYVRQWVPYAIDKAMEMPGWETIDMVKHALPDEEWDPANPFSGYLYSSKPTLLPTLMAIPYWILYHATGMSLKSHPFLMVRLLLIIINLIPLLISWFLMSRLIDRFGGSDWGKIFAMGVLCFGTFLSTFAVTLNNHLPCVVFIIFALYAAARIIVDGERRKRYFIIAALFGSLAVACEIPAILIAGFLCLALLGKCPRRTIFVAVPCAVVVVAAFFGTNYVAHQTIRQAYAHKRDSLQVAQLKNTPEFFDSSDWYVYRYFPNGAARNLKKARLSYWSDRQGIDQGEASRGRYAFHALVGHHGLFSLTPVWILSLAGLFSLAIQSSAGTFRREKRLFAAAVLFAALFFFVFYLTRNQGDRNYGGMTCGLRWFFPLIPFWILSMLPVLDRMAQSRFGRGTALALLFVSAMSAAYPLWNPWTHPWLFNLLIDMGWKSGF